MQTSIDIDLISYFVGCHPVRLLADMESHLKINKPLILPFSMMPKKVKDQFCTKEILDYIVLKKMFMNAIRNIVFYLHLVLYALAISKQSGLKNLDGCLTVINKISVMKRQHTY